MNVKNYVLDSFAILTYFQNEAGAELVQQLMSSAAGGEAALFMSWVNLGEVVYIIQRKAGREMAKVVVSAVDMLPVEVVEVDRDLALGAAEIKAGYAVSYADCFALALAKRVEGVVATGDPEFKKTEDLVPVYWLPAKR